MPASTKTKTRSAYSQADWKFHKNKLGYDYIIDDNGRLIATVNVMDMAALDILSEKYQGNDLPKEIQIALNKLGKLTNQRFAFNPYQLPARLKQHYQQEKQEFEEEIEQAGTISFSWRGLSDKSTPTKIENNRMKPSQKRLAAILTHRLKI
ncbi:MAG TPA: hypothetical protein VHZ04_02935 [Candidatus Paceibacterota bacterium]|jgi:hypothetical protein|nr:hypothetical protein [Candidatus Paceibacterota bacterium]